MNRSVSKKLFALVIATIAVALFSFRNSSFTTPQQFDLKIVDRPSLLTSTTTNIFLVSRVVDGDTIELANGEKVRYIGINAPESVKPNTPVECFALEAKEKNRELVEGKEVRLEKDVSNKDKYGRLLRYVYVGDLFVNLVLVKDGYANVSTYPPDIKYAATLTKAQTEARSKGAGLWTSCRQ